MLLAFICDQVVVNVINLPTNSIACKNMSLRQFRKTFAKYLPEYCFFLKANFSKGSYVIGDV